jgi:hypothetical protein
MWYLEDPVTLVHKTADPALKEQPLGAGFTVRSKTAYWGVFYTSLVFLIVYEASSGGLCSWFADFVRTAFVDFAPWES